MSAVNALVLWGLWSLHALLHMASKCPRPTANVEKRAAFSCNLEVRLPRNAAAVPRVWKHRLKPRLRQKVVVYIAVPRNKRGGGGWLESFTGGLDLSSSDLDPYAEQSTAWRATFDGLLNCRITCNCTGPCSLHCFARYCIVLCRERSWRI